MDISPPLPLPREITEFYVPSHDLKYHVLSAGPRGKPLILCLHGFPELAFTWRKIMPAIADHGYYVVAYDQRGYGRTTGWDNRDFSMVDLNTFTYTRLVRDAVILVNALGYNEVTCVIGHDFGAVGASMCALMRPDLFKSIITMSHPFKGSPSLPFNTISHPQPPSQEENVHKALAQLPKPRIHYKWYYSNSNAASEMDNPKEELEEFLRGYFYLKSAGWKGNDPKPLKAWEAEELAKLPYYYVMPLNSSMREAVTLSMSDEDPSTVSKLVARWLSDQELGVYVKEFAQTGFQGSLNFYRIATDPKNMKDVEVFSGMKIDVPMLFISGKEDWGTYQEPGVFENLSKVCTRFKGAELVEDAGHWVQQEQPQAVIKLVTKFLSEVKIDSMDAITQ